MRLVVRFAPVTFEVDENDPDFAKLHSYDEEKLAEYVMENYLFDQDLRAGAMEIDTVEIVEPVTGVDSRD